MCFVCVCVCVCVWRDHLNCFLIPAESTLNTYHLNNASLYKGLLLFVYTHNEKNIVLLKKTNVFRFFPA